MKAITNTITNAKTAVGIQYVVYSAKSLCLLLLVNIHPNITSIGSKKAFPKLSIAAFLMSILLPDKSTVLNFKTLLPIDWPIVYSKYVQYPKKAALDIM